MTSHMNRILVIPIMVTMPLACPAQRNHGACIVQKTYTDADTTKYMESRVYGNGLGDIIEEVQVGVTPSGKDLVVLKEYDAFRRMSKNWLPAIIPETGVFASPGNVRQTATTNHADTKPYALTTYDKWHTAEESEVYKPGADWHDNGRCTRHQYIFSGGEVYFASPYDGIQSQVGASRIEYSYPSVSKKFISIILNKCDTKKEAPNNGRIWTKKD